MNDNFLLDDVDIQILFKGEKINTFHATDTQSKRYNVLNSKSGKILYSGSKEMCEFFMISSQLENRGQLDLKCLKDGHVKFGLNVPKKRF